jgi:6-phosphogluconolactonase
VTRTSRISRNAQNDAVTVELIVLDDAGAAADHVGQLLAEAARQGGHIALSGGKSPERAHETAATLEPDWSRAELWWGDERCVPPDDERSNFGMAKRTLLDKVAVPPAGIHRIRGEIEPDTAAAEYDAALRGVHLRLNLLGLGPDGHTASLFPNAPGLRERERLAIAAEPGLDPRVTRVTMTPPMLEDADLVLFLVTGASKAEAAARAFAGPGSTDTPASLIRSRHGRTLAVLDRPAAALIES